MTNYDLYPDLPSAPQGAFHLTVIQSKRQGLLKLEDRYKEKYKKYTKILNRLTWLNACSSSLSIASGISSVAALSTLISLPVGISLGAVSLAGASVSGVATALTKKYQKKLKKVTKLIDIITQALAVFETGVSKALKDGKIDEEEFNMLQTLHLKVLNELADVHRKMEAENRYHFEKRLLEEINEI